MGLTTEPIRQGLPPATRKDRRVYFGSPDVTSVTCVLATIDLTRLLPWFAVSVRDIRMLRIEELNDLMPVIQQVIDQP